MDFFADAADCRFEGKLLGRVDTLVASCLLMTGTAFVHNITITAPGNNLYLLEGKGENLGLLDC